MSGKKFRFSLQDVLDLRKHETAQARQALTDATAACAAQERRVKRVRERLAEPRHAGHGMGRVRPAALQQAAAFRHQARRSLTEAREVLSEHEAEVQQARAALQSRRQAQEGLETLREREEEQHEQEQAEAARAFLDEQAVLRHNRTSKPSLLS